MDWYFLNLLSRSPHLKHIRRERKADQWRSRSRPSGCLRCSFLQITQLKRTKHCFALAFFPCVSPGHPSCVLRSVCPDRPFQPLDEGHSQCGARKATPEADWSAGLDDGCASFPCRRSKYCPSVHVHSFELFIRHSAWICFPLSVNWLDGKWCCFELLITPRAWGFQAGKATNLEFLF